ncbi:hypothetical protein BKA66DRAFT_448187 [Pyrenochaeta sp. MPI-SDFR-AT-0127]|nr:hypothetical protein BKA66DRAFT_448187 [Pyrenochaeta sp. MPI-SDFR-AT-0127]
MTITSPTPPTTSLRQPASQTTEQTEAHFLSILFNWNLNGTTNNDILPPGLHLENWSTPLLETVAELSDLTIGQKQRAHNLLNTYFHERIRQSSYRGNAGSIYAHLEVGDVEKAIESVQKMSRGLALQNAWKGRAVLEEFVGGEEQREGSRKRKYPPQEEALVDAVEVRAEKKRNTGSGECLPHTPEALLPHQPSSPIRHITHTPPAKHKDLPRITTAIHSPLHAPQRYIPTQRVVQAAQQATHEFNLRRLELANAEAEVEAARQRLMDARQRMEDARVLVDGSVWS